jgi:DNA-binding beta-propeller fold protein YncE
LRARLRRAIVTLSMVRFAIVILVVVPAALLAAPGDVMKDAPAPCVHRGSAASTVRFVTHVELTATTLDYCTGDDCWSYDLAKRVVTSMPSRAPGPRGSHYDAEGELTDGRGTTLATADDKHAEFCPHGVKPCVSIRYDVPIAVARVYPAMNAAGTLGAVHCIGVGDIDQEGYVVAFDLAAKKELGRLPVHHVRVLDHGFVIGDKYLRDAAFKKVGDLGVADAAWTPLGSTDRIVQLDTKKAEFVVQDTTTAKVLARFATGAAPGTFYELVVARDAKTVYAIGSTFSEGEVVTIDPVAGKITSRVAPPICAAGTMRRR